MLCHVTATQPAASCGPWTSNHLSGTCFNRHRRRLHQFFATCMHVLSAFQVFLFGGLNSNNVVLRDAWVLSTNTPAQQSFSSQHSTATFAGPAHPSSSGVPQLRWRCSVARAGVSSTAARARDACTCTHARHNRRSVAAMQCHGLPADKATCDKTTYAPRVVFCYVQKVKPKHYTRSLLLINRTKSVTLARSS